MHIPKQHEESVFGKEAPRNSGTIMEHIDPLTLVRQTPLKCFGEVFQEKLFNCLRVFLNRLEESWL